MIVTGTCDPSTGALVEAKVVTIGSTVGAAVVNSGARFMATGDFVGMGWATDFVELTSLATKFRKLLLLRLLRVM